MALVDGAETIHAVEADKMALVDGAETTYTVEANLKHKPDEFWAV
jgi:hypothetical protein